MGIVQYAFFAFAATAAISYLVVALIVIIDRIMSKSDGGEPEGGNE